MGMEIRIKDRLDNRNYKGFTFKGVDFLRTAEKIWGSVNDGKGWRGLGRGGYEYIIIDGDKFKIFDSLREVKIYINAVRDVEAAQKRLAMLSA